MPAKNESPSKEKPDASGQANGTIHYHLPESAGTDRKVIFIPDEDHIAKRGESRFAVFLPTELNGGGSGFLHKIDPHKGVYMELNPEGEKAPPGEKTQQLVNSLLCDAALCYAALHGKKITVMVTKKNDQLILKSAIIPAE